jgi:hypothetical protein
LEQSVAETELEFIGSKKKEEPPPQHWFFTFYQELGWYIELAAPGIKDPIRVSITRESCQ